jgi:hypothetical protein
VPGTAAQDGQDFIAGGVHKHGEVSLVTADHHLLRGGETAQVERFHQDTIFAFRSRRIMRRFCLGTLLLCVSIICPPPRMRKLSPWAATAADV